MKKFIITLLCLVGVSQAAYSLTCLKDYGGDGSCLANTSPAGDCETLGYATTDVEGCLDYIYCPFDSDYKKCIFSKNWIDCAKYGFNDLDKSAWCSNIVECPSNSSLTLCAAVCYSEQNMCERHHVGAVCTQTDGCYAPALCKTGYCDTGTACNIVCSETDYPYVDQIEHAQMTGECKGYLGTSESTCTGEVVLRYADYTCEANYCKKDDRCQPLCDETAYPVVGEVDNAIMSDAVCIGYLGASDGTCSGDGLTRYASFECEEGYRKNAQKTACVVDTCPYADKQDCQDNNPNSNCVVDTALGLDACYVPSTCKTGYVKDCPADASELTDADANGCGYCNCPTGKAITYKDMCVPAFANCEAAGLVTPASKEKEVCGEAAIEIVKTDGTTLKCYEDRCSYSVTVEECTMKTVPCSTGPLQTNTKCSVPHLVKMRYRYIYNTSSGKFEKGYGIAMNTGTRLTGTNCDGVAPSNETMGSSNGGGGGLSTQVCNNELDIAEVLYAKGSVLTNVMAVMRESGLYTITANTCTYLTEYNSED